MKKLQNLKFADIKKYSVDKLSKSLYFLSDKINLFQVKLTGAPSFDEAFKAYKIVEDHFNSMIRSKVNEFVGKSFGPKGSEPRNNKEWDETNGLVISSPHSTVAKYFEKKNPEEQMKHGAVHRTKGNNVTDYFGNLYVLNESDSEIVGILNNYNYKLDNTYVSWQGVFVTVKNLLKRDIIKNDNFDKFYSKLSNDNYSVKDVKEFCELLQSEFEKIMDKKFIQKHGKILEVPIEKEQENTSDVSENINNSDLFVKDDTTISSYINDLRKYRNLIASLHYVYLDLDKKNIDKNKTYWCITNTDEFILNISVNELTGNHAEELFDYVTTKEFGQNIIDTINLMNIYEAQKFLKQDTEKLLKEQQIKPIIEFPDLLNLNSLSKTITHNLNYLLNHPLKINVPELIYVINEPRHRSQQEALQLIKLMTKIWLEKIILTRYSKDLELAARYIIDSSQSFDECYEFLLLTYDVLDSNKDYDNKLNDEFKFKKLIEKYSKHLCH